MKIEFKMNVPDKFLEDRDVKSSVRSALGSSGYFMRQEILKQIDTEGSYLGAKWKPLHSMSLLRSTKQYGKQGKRRINKRKKPLAKYKKFVRYRYDNNAAQVTFTTKRTGKPGQIQRDLIPFVLRHEKGEHQRLTKKSMAFRAALGFPVSKSTTSIRIPKRPILSPFIAQKQSETIKVFEKKFEESLMRKQNA